jgi:hypothetical protein
MAMISQTSAPRSSPTASRRFVCDAVSDRRDPTRTTDVRRSWQADFNKRTQALKRSVRVTLVEKDLLGFAGLMSGPRAGSAAFSSWFSAELRRTVYADQGAWMRRHVERAWTKGATQAAAQIRHPYRLDLREAGEQLFVAQTDLAAIVSAAEQAVVRTVAALTARGSGSKAIVREVNAVIDRVMKRGKVLIEHHTIAAHSEASLDVAEDAGITHVRRIPEHVPVRVFGDTKARYVRWLTAGDSKVCRACSQMDEEIIKISQARRMIPVHPNCRCAWELVGRDELLELDPSLIEE